MIAIKKIRNIATFLLFAGLLGNPIKNANAEGRLEMNLFPREPLYRTTMVDPDLFHSGTRFPTDSINLEGVLETPISELLGYSSLSKTLPLIALGLNGRHLPRRLSEERITENLDRAERERIWLSNKLLNANLVASGLIKTPPSDTDADISYRAKLELFINSPMTDDYASDGNRLYLTGGWIGEGSTRLNKNILDQDILSLAKTIEFPFDNYSFFTNVYIVGRSRYSEQSLILRIGIDNLFGNTEENPNVSVSTAWEFPSIFRTLKVSPYFSSHIRVPTDGSETESIGQLGFKFSGESGREIDLYGEVHYAQENNEPWKFFYGTKFSL